MEQEKPLLKSIELKEIRLGLWEELVGNFEWLEISEFNVAVVLSCRGEKLQIRVDRAKADIITKELLSCKSGTMVALMKTDEASRPFVARTIRT